MLLNKAEDEFGTLVIGNCLEIMPDFPGAGTVDLILTDPPYKGLDYNKGFGLGRRTEHKSDEWYDSNFKTEKYKYGGGYVEYSEWLPKVYRILKSTGSIVVFERSNNLFELVEPIISTGFKFGGVGIWYITNKASNAASSKAKRPVSNYEIWVWASKNDKYYYDAGSQLRDVYMSSTVRYDYGEESYGSDLEVGGKKPVELLRNIIKAFCPENGKVLDCFVGSGSTCLASRLENRYWYAIEIDERLTEAILLKSRPKSDSLLRFI